VVEIQCPSCKKTHRVLKDKIPSSDAKVRCSRCKHVFVHGTKCGCVDPPIPGGKNIEKVERSNPSVPEKQEKNTAQPGDLNFQQAFQILGLDTEASSDGISESYVNTCAVCLRHFDVAHDKSRLAERLHEINRAYEIALNYINAEKPFEEEAFNEINRACDVKPNSTTTRISSPSQGTLQNHNPEDQISDSKMNTQGLFFETYTNLLSHSGIFIPVIITSFLVFISSQFVNIALPIAPQFIKMVTGRSMPSWVTYGCVYIIFGVLVIIILCPLTVFVFESIIKQITNINRYILMFIDSMCIKVFKCYMLVGSILFFLLMSFMIPSVIVMHYYVESIEITLLILCLNVVAALLVIMFLSKRCLLWPYIVMNSEESIFIIFRHIHQVTIKNVLLIWIVDLPLIIIAIILKSIQKYIDSQFFLMVVDYLLSLNFIVVVCISMILISLFYVRKLDSREMMIVRKN
jgi:predicted Zn finger-like uncharacterized protein